MCECFQHPWLALFIGFVLNLLMLAATIDNKHLKGADKMAVIYRCVAMILVLIPFVFTLAVGMMIILFLIKSFFAWLHNGSKDHGCYDDI